MPFDRIPDAPRAADDGHVDTGLSVAIDLHESLLRLGAIDGVYIVVEEIPPGVRFSAGRFNGDDTWSLGPGEIDGLRAILPPHLGTPFTLTVRVLTPDPCGYDYASTTAKFDVVVTPGSGASAAADMVAPMEPPAGRPLPAADDAKAAEERRFAAARAEWAAEEELRLARSRAQWEATERERWLAREADLGAQHAAALADAEARWKQREANRIAAVEAQWSARLVANEARWRAEDGQIHAAAPPRRARRGVVANLVAVLGFSCIALAVLML
ncbi:MAG: hypothetical protein AB7S71_06685 [Dongiaceae bacterium]